MHASAETLLPFLLKSSLKQGSVKDLSTELRSAPSGSSSSSTFHIEATGSPVCLQPRKRQLEHKGASMTICSFGAHGFGFAAVSCRTEVFAVVQVIAWHLSYAAGCGVPPCTKIGNGHIKQLN